MTYLQQHVYVCVCDSCIICPSETPSTHWWFLWGCVPYICEQNQAKYKSILWPHESLMDINLLQKKNLLSTHQQSCARQHLNQSNSQEHKTEVCLSNQVMKELLQCVSGANQNSWLVWAASESLITSCFSLIT